MKLFYLVEKNIQKFLTFWTKLNTRFLWEKENLMFVCWNSRDSCIQSLINGKVDWEIPGCPNQPKLFTKNNNIAAFLDDNGKLTFFSIETKLTIEVLPVHHGLSSIDNVSLLGDDRVVLFDYTAERVVTSEICLSTSLSLKWEVRNLYSCSRTRHQHSLDYMFATYSRIVALCSDKMFSATYRLWLLGLSKHPFHFPFCDEILQLILSGGVTS